MIILLIFLRATESRWHACGGAILNEWQIISVAHCFNRKSRNLARWLVIPKIIDQNDLRPLNDPSKWPHKGIPKNGLSKIL